MNHSESSGGDINIFWKLPVYSGVKNQHRGPPRPSHLLPHLSTDPPHPRLSLSRLQDEGQEGSPGRRGGSVGGLGGSSRVAASCPRAEGQETSTLQLGASGPIPPGPWECGVWERR